MKLFRHSFIAVACFPAAACLFGQAPSAEGPHKAAGTVRGGIAGRVEPPPSGAGAMEMEKVTYLGIVTGQVMPALAAQLNLTEGTGLIVESTEPGSPAAEAFKTHDILLKLDDQILVVEEQFSVLIRNHKEGDAVSINYLRGGREEKVTVKLRSHEVPKRRALAYDPLASGQVAFVAPSGGVGVIGVQGGPISGAEADRVLSAIPRGPRGEPMTNVKVDDQGAQGLRITSMHPANSEMAYNDETGSLRLTIRDGHKSVVATDPKGATVFSGSVTTPEERKALPAAVRERLEKLENLQGATFQTDGEFKGGKTRVLLPKKPST